MARVVAVELDRCEIPEIEWVGLGIYRQVRAEEAETVKFDS